MKQRSLKNFFVKPEFQLKFSLFFVVTGGVILGLVSYSVLSKLGQVQGLMNNSPRIDFMVQSQMHDLMSSCIQYAMFGFMSYIVIAFTFALRMSHKIAGPQVAISAYIEALRQGDYTFSRSLRPGDELNEIMDGLDDLRSTLIKYNELKGNGVLSEAQK